MRNILSPSFCSKADIHSLNLCTSIDSHVVKDVVEMASLAIIFLAAAEAVNLEFFRNIFPLESRGMKISLLVVDSIIPFRFGSNARMLRSLVISTTECSHVYMSAAEFKDWMANLTLFTSSWLTKSILFKRILSAKET